MGPSVFAIVSANAGVLATFRASDGIVRVFPFGFAPQGVRRPYAVWQVVSGGPDNALADRPNSDRFVLQFDVYADDADTASAAAETLRRALELNAHIVSFRAFGREADTNLYRVSYDVEWIELRSVQSS